MLIELTQLTHPFAVALAGGLGDEADDLALDERRLVAQRELRDFSKTSEIGVTSKSVMFRVSWARPRARTPRALTPRGRCRRREPPWRWRARWRRQRNRSRGYRQQGTYARRRHRLRRRDADPGRPGQDDGRNLCGRRHGGLQTGPGGHLRGWPGQGGQRRLHKEDWDVEAPPDSRPA